MLKLKAEGKLELLADAQLRTGKYDQLRLDISGVAVTDADGQHEAKLPSGELKIRADIAVEPNRTSTASFDFIADESLHVTGSGKYIMAPVIKLETRENADVEIKSGNKVEIKGGRMGKNLKVGMDIEGNVDVGVKIPEDAQIEIEESGKIRRGK